MSNVKIDKSQEEKESSLNQSNRKSQNDIENSQRSGNQSHLKSQNDVQSNQKSQHSISRSQGEQQNDDQEEEKYDNMDKNQTLQQSLIADDINNEYSILAKSQLKEKNKVFITEQKKIDESLIWKAYDFLFPAGKLSKLVRVYDTFAKNFPYNEILNRLKLTEGYPVINLIGAKECGRGKFYAGLTRAAQNTDAIIVTSAIQSGIEKYAMRRNLKLIGIAPEKKISFPKINPTSVQSDELANGHSHFFLLNNKSDDMQWSMEFSFKINICLKLAEGKKKSGLKRCKIVNVLLADNPYYYEECKAALKNGLPVLIVKGSKVCNSVLDKEDDKKGVDTEFLELIQQKKDQIIYLDSNNSEDIAQYVHFLLTVSPWDTQEDTQKREGLKNLISDGTLGGIYDAEKVEKEEKEEQQRYQNQENLRSDEEDNN